VPSLSRLEFAELAAAAVEAVGVESANGRVHVVPGERMLRYYTTQGVMDRPQLVVTASGKEARYGRRHLLQFVAAKRLQAGGASLPDIRRRLAQVSDAELAGLAAIPAGVIPPDLADVDVPAPPDAPPFWHRRPAEARPATITEARPATGAEPRPGAGPARTAFIAASAPAPRHQPPVGMAAPAASRATLSPVVGAPGRTVTVVTLGPGIEVQIDHAIHSPAQVALLAAALASAVSTTLPASREEP